MEVKTTAPATTPRWGRSAPRFARGPAGARKFQMFLGSARCGGSAVRGGHSFSSVVSLTQASTNVDAITPKRQSCKIFN